MIHNITKKICKICNPKAYCEHNKLKNNCIDCKGINICEHSKIKSICKECGINFCIHGKYKSTCKECKGLELNLKIKFCRVFCFKVYMRTKYNLHLKLSVEYVKNST